MSREKNIFEKFPKKWPKGVFARRVGGERGNIDLPSGAKGGEKMDLDRHDEHKQPAILDYPHPPFTRTSVLFYALIIYLF